MSTRLAINVLPASRRARAALRAHIRGWCVLTGCWAVVIAIGVASFRMIEPAPAAPARGADPATLARRIDEANASLRLVRTQLQAARAQVEAAEWIEDHPDWSALLDLLASMAGEVAQLKSIEIIEDAPAETKPKAQPSSSGAAQAAQGAKPPVAASRPPERFVARIGGLARSAEDVTGFVLALEKLALFKSVRLVETAPRDYFGLPAAGFRIECVLAERTVPPDQVPPAARRDGVGPPVPAATATVPETQGSER